MKYLYMMVDTSKYELPIAVADSPKELSAMVGVSAKRITEDICKAKTRGAWNQFLRIPVEGDFTLPVRGERIGDGRRVRIKMESEREYREFESLKSAAMYLGRNQSTIGTWLQKGHGGGYEWSKV